MKPKLLSKIDEYCSAGWWMEMVCPQAALGMSLFKKDGKLRFVVDCWKQNDNTIKDLTPLPDQDTIRHDVARAKYRSKLDLTDAFEQVQVINRDVWKTAFSTPFGTYVSRVMQMGDTNAPATFQT